MILYNVTVLGNNIIFQLYKNVSFSKPIIFYLIYSVTWLLKHNCLSNNIVTSISDLKSPSTAHNQHVLPFYET